MSRVALYRKYRSADFDDVVGQRHVTQTLKSAVEKGMVSHAYLLTGPRGVGKTSIARILARNVNQLPAETDLERELDVIEIDAASNRGIDEMRSLRERILSAPTKLKYKVYIIDEVHMLTREAFNALLKTLEEPPAHAIFILATTEAQKLPDTIISRTQRFDLRPITTSDLVERLGAIAKSEGIEVDSDALELIAASSRGGFRDAIGLLDQLSVLGGKLDRNQVANILGMAAGEDIELLITAIAAGDRAAGFSRASSLLSAGNEPISLTNQIMEVLRRSMIAESTTTKASAHSLVALEPEQLVYFIDCFTGALADFKVSQHYSLPLEAAIYEASLWSNISNRPNQPNTSTPTAGSVSANSSTLTEAKPTPAAKAGSAPEPTKAKATDGGKPPAKAHVDTESLCIKGLSLIKERNNSLYAVMRSANPRVEGDDLVLECRFSFHKERLEETKNRQVIEQIMTKTFGRPIQLTCRLSRPADKLEPTDNNQELVASALEILGGEVVSG